MKLSPRSVFGGQPPIAINTGGYRYQPGTILTTLNPSPTVPTFGSSFSPPAVPTIGSLWGAAPPTSSGIPYTPNLPSNTVNPVATVGTPFTGGGTVATNTGGNGFFTLLSSGLFK